MLALETLKTKSTTDMTYGFKRYGSWTSPYWKDEAKDSPKNIVNSNSDEYAQLSLEQFKDVLHDELDIPDYEITSENIYTEFGFDCRKTKNEAKCIEHLVEYYKWRKELFDRIVAAVVDNTSFGGIQDRFEALGCDELRIRFNMPAKYNNFSTEDPDYDGGQTEAYIEVVMYK